MSKKIIYANLIIFGLALLIYTWQPVISWYFFVKPSFNKDSSFLTPMAASSQNQILDKNSILESNSSDKKQNSFGSSDFFLTVEKFGIKKAEVVTGDNFLTQLAHFPSSALPGDVGNVVISGHSALPQLFSPESYWSIFSKLYLLEIGDQIILEADGATYTYQINQTLVVTPHDLWVLAAPDQFGSYLTLLTCGVGGFNLDRIIIRATLVNSQKIV